MKKDGISFFFKDLHDQRTKKISLEFLLYTSIIFSAPKNVFLLSHQGKHYLFVQSVKNRKLIRGNILNKNTTTSPNGFILSNGLLLRFLLFVLTRLIYTCVWPSFMKIRILSTQANIRSPRICIASNIR